MYRKAAEDESSLASDVRAVPGDTGDYDSGAVAGVAATPAAAAAGLSSSKKQRRPSFDTSGTYSFNSDGSVHY